MPVNWSELCEKVGDAATELKEARGLLQASQTDDQDLALLAEEVLDLYLQAEMARARFELNAE